MKLFKWKKKRTRKPKKAPKNYCQYREGAGYRRADFYEWAKTLKKLKGELAYDTGKYCFPGIVAHIRYCKACQAWARAQGLPSQAWEE